ncbi:alpha/beta hydrolase [Piscinibacter terrae]|uniref:Serine aminopeptidase S33 domain-containing protein n=1 Tax=Piscinibacter terrae TaxID=2496871 RepID=A0A3N7JLZ7_9BURK|nr:hypothetical protein [Albitalea terrae]RQP22289.1 hypothetical protein DZC73_24895 [Albitalea terrae]
MRRMLAGTVIFVAALYLLLCAGLFFFQRSLLYFPPPANAADAARTAMQAQGLTLAVTTRSVPGDAAVVYFGGNAEDVSFSLPDLAAAFPSHSLYLLHYPGYSGNAGSPNEAAIRQAALALFDAVHRDHAKVIVIGRSLGSGVAIGVAAQRPVERLVLVTPYDSIVDIAAGQFPFVPVRWIMLDKYESWRYVPQVKAPTTIVVAQFDEVIPAASSRRLFERFGPGAASYLTIASTGHNTISQSADYVRALSGLPTSSIQP